jgi:hypothetical protein
MPVSQGADRPSLSGYDGSAPPHPGSDRSRRRQRPIRLRGTWRCSYHRTAGHKKCPAGTARFDHFALRRRFFPLYTTGAPRHCLIRYANIRTGGLGYLNYEFPFPMALPPPFCRRRLWLHISPEFVHKCILIVIRWSSDLYVSCCLFHGFSYFAESMTPQLRYLLTTISKIGID